MPIITYSGKRSGKVAPKITDKGYCSTKSMYYYGMKLHALCFCNTGRLPHPEQIIFTPASVNDLLFIKTLGLKLKITHSLEIKYIMTLLFFKRWTIRSTLKCWPPVTAIKEMAVVLKKFDRAYNDLYPGLCPRSGSL